MYPAEFQIRMCFTRSDPDLTFQKKPDPVPTFKKKPSPDPALDKPNPDPT